MKHQVVSQGGGQGPEGNSGSKYKIPVTLSFIALALPGCLQAAETAIVNKNLELKAGDWHSFSNQSEGMTPKEKVILDNYAVSASLFLNPLNEIRSTPLTIGGTSVLQNNAISSDGIVNKVEFAVTDIKSVDASGQSVSNTSTIISFRDDNVEPTEGEFDVTTKSFIFDSNLSTSAIRSETDEHTLVTLRGADLNRQTAPFMIIVMDKLPANANIHEAMKDPKKVREVSIFNPVTGEELVVPQEEQTSSPPTSTPTPNELPFDIIELIGNLIEPSQGVSAQEPTSTPGSDEAPSVPMIEVDGLQIPDPKASNPELFDVTNPDSPIVQFANTFGVSPEDVGELTPQLKTGADGKQFVALTTGDISTTVNFDESGTPLLIAEKGEGGEWEWREIKMKDLANASGIKIGCLVDPAAEFWNNTIWQEKAASEFNLGVLGFYWHVTIPNQDEYFFGLADAQVELAKKNNMDLRAEPLLVGNYIPDWLRNGSFTKDQWIGFVQKYIPVFMKRYENDINTWVVVNEAGFNSPYREGDLFYQHIGKEYVEIAFQAARQKDPSATLIYGDFGNYTLNGPKYEQTKQIVETLRQKKLIDGVGMEILIDPSKPIPSKQELIDAMKSYDLPIYITELDVDLRNVKGTNMERYELQAKITQTIIEAALESGVVKQITFWNIGDKYSYLEQTEWNGSINADPTIFDDNLNPKKNYYATIQALLSSLLGR